ncbi:hypothetical protein ACFVRD_36945 [Streptomyces sp. NPDC057908]|uniref:hypothetical protein n=1 Tax=Streptomyces sp. NPDC057908 TaxID=3346276 RepID=UPI0036F0B1A3
MANAHDIMQRMRERQAAREKAFEPLAEILGQRQELQRQLAALDEPYGQAFATAEAGGWTTDELMEIGAEEPVKRPKGRPRGKQRATAKKSAPEAATGNSSTNSPAAAVPTQNGAAEAEPVTASTSG